jgi:hypothetical protein
VKLPAVILQLACRRVPEVDESASQTSK